MNRQDLDRKLPDGIANFNEWEAAIPKYRTALMKRLDSLDLAGRPENWTREALYEIVLWELNRYPEIDEELFRDLARAAEIPPGEHRRGKDLLLRLLNCRNVGLTMATAILRFVNPETFQTLNARNGFVVLGQDPPSNQPEDIPEYYFHYLDELRKLTGNGFDFRFADRLLYQVDKADGHRLTKKQED